MIDKRAIAICGQMLPGFIEWRCMERWMALYGMYYIVHGMVWYGFMDHLGMSLRQSWFMLYIALSRKLFRWVAKELKINIMYL